MLVVKAAVAYKAAYAPIAGTIIAVDTPGLTASNPARYTYHKIRRPILPLDPESDVEATHPMNEPIEPIRVAPSRWTPKLGEVAANRDGDPRPARRSRGRSGARLVVFPECALTGYGFDSRAEALRVRRADRRPVRRRRSPRPAGRWASASIFGFLEARRRAAVQRLRPGRARRPGRRPIARSTCPFLGVDRFADPGDRPFAVHDAGGVKVGMHICYDGAFPETGRVLTLLGADLLVLPTNWPTHSECAAEHMIATRAMENVVYCDGRQPRRRGARLPVHRPELDRRRPTARSSRSPAPTPRRSSTPTSTRRRPGRSG